MKEISKILVAIDKSKMSQEALKRAISIAKEKDAQLHVIHKNIKNDNSDLLVLGSKGVNSLNSLIFGSTATYLLQRSPIDTLVYVPLKSKNSSAD